MELKIDNFNLPEKVGFNYEEMRTELATKLNEYRGLVYTDDKITEAKADKAYLNKVSKALSDERIRVEKEFKKPLEVFSSQIKELCGMISTVVKEIDTQVKGYEEKEKAEKLEKIKELFGKYEWKGFPFEGICNPAWLNKTTSLKAIEQSMQEASAQIVSDLTYIFESEELKGFEEIAKDCYIATRSLSEAIRHALATKAKITTPKVAEPVPVPAEEVTEVHEEAPAETAEESATWITFRALLTVAQAKALGDWCRERNIDLRVEDFFA